MPWRGKIFNLQRFFLETFIELKFSAMSEPMQVTSIDDTFKSKLKVVKMQCIFHFVSFQCYSIEIHSIDYFFNLVRQISDHIHAK